MILALALLVLSAVHGLPAASQRPCDILVAAGNPCVAAHSTTRALYANYSGPLYKVTRSSDQRSANIGLLSPGGFADATQHDEFCAKGDCVISNVFDQSPMGNHLGKRPGHKFVNASLHRITVTEHKVPVYGMWFDQGHGYTAEKTKGIATGNDPESIYAVMSGKRFNGGCCFDYGNAEIDGSDDGCGAMEAIYFGNAHWWGNTGAGKTGPWVVADLETGMYYGGGWEHTWINERNKPLPFDFVTAYLRGGTDGFMLKGGDATNGTLTTMYDGPRPKPLYCEFTKDPKKRSLGYQPMRKQGAIILATGGDNSNSGIGNFYEGVMVTGVTNDATDDAVQENIVAVGYRDI